MKICVFGAASDEIDETYIAAVEKLGEKMAEKGHSLVFGAGGNGLMGAAARGVHKLNGNVIGVIPKFFRDENIEKIYDKCDELIFTETMAERKEKMENLADAFITVPGGIGTFEEFFEVLTLKQLGRHRKPIAIFDINEYYKKLGSFISASVDEHFIRGGCKDLWFYNCNADEILNYIENDDREGHNLHDVKIG